MIGNHDLRDSGVNVVIGLPESSKSRAKAEAAGLRVLANADAAKAFPPDDEPWEPEAEG